MQNKTHIPLCFLFKKILVKQSFSQNVEDGLAGLKEREAGVVKAFETFKITTIIKKHKCGCMKEIYTQLQIMKSALQDTAFLMQVAEPAQYK